MARRRRRWRRSRATGGHRCRHQAAGDATREKHAEKDEKGDGGGEDGAAAEEEEEEEEEDEEEGEDFADERMSMTSRVARVTATSICSRPPRSTLMRSRWRRTRPTCGRQAGAGGEGDVPRPEPDAAAKLSEYSAPSRRVTTKMSRSP